MEPSASTRFRDNLTFSSTLLDQIYRSIDQQSQPTVCSQTTRIKHTNFLQHDSRILTSPSFNDHEPRPCLYQKLMQNKVYQKPLIRRSYTTSCGYSSSKPKHDEFIIKREKDDSPGTDKDDAKFMNTKAKALKMYNHLKKMKQPISPGGRLTTFFNSLFTTGNNKKPNRKSKSVNASSTCSLATTSSYSRECLGHTTLSRNKFSNEINKSVRLYPVSVFVDEETDSNTNGFSESLIGKSVKLDLSNENTRVSEAGRSLLRDYEKKVECESHSVTKVEDEDEDESNDGESDSSSDLFELKNLSPFRIRSYQEELPIYATTNLHTNRAIANSNLM